MLRMVWNSCNLLFLQSVLLLFFFFSCQQAQSFIPHTGHPFVRHVQPHQQSLTRVRDSTMIIIVNNEDEEPPEEEEEDDDEVMEEDPYTKVASSEFVDKPDVTPTSASSSIVSASPAPTAPTTALDWGGALGKLRQRMQDVETGKSQDPSHVLFRVMSAQSPNQAIGTFIQTANPQVVQAMSGAVNSLLGGLNNPLMGTEILVKASGEKIGSLCFQLQMTGYMFRNAEYVVALKNLMKLRGSATLQEYKDAFQKLDTDGSGYIDAKEIADLLDDVYDGKTPAFEITAFMQFFDQNKDGKVSWAEFERGLGVALARQADAKTNLNLLPGTAAEDDEDVPELATEISGTIEIELEDGKVVEVEAKEYIESLKEEAEALKEVLRREKMGAGSSNNENSIPMQAMPSDPQDELSGIASYIASRQGDLKSLTEGISPDIVNTMKLLVDYVLEGGESAQAKKIPKDKMEMEIPGSALQQLALWQLILGYRLREAEAKGDYLKLLE